MEKSIFKKMIASFNKNENKNIQQPEFYIPTHDTLKAFATHQPMTYEQISDYINYIKSNYYVSAEDASLLLDFAGEWSKYSLQEDQMIKRKSDAMACVAKRLLAGKEINMIDAFWISDKIYIDSDDKARKRIVTKTIVNDKADLNIDLNKKNSYVGFEIDILQVKLETKTYLKPVDKTI